jgi:hypothetical protein
MKIWTVGRLGAAALFLCMSVAGAMAQSNPGLSPRYDSLRIGASSSLLSAGPTTPGGNSGAAGTMALDWVLAGTPAAKTQLINEGFLWSSKVRSGFGFARNFNSSDSSTTGYPGSFAGPNAAVIMYSGNDGSNNDVLPLLTIGNARASNTTVFGGNDVARSNGGGLTNVKLVGREIDVQPAPGDTVNSGSGGLYLNAFTTEIPIGIQIGGYGGGSWTNGIIYSANISGTGLGVQAGVTIGSLVNCANATFTTGCIVTDLAAGSVPFIGANKQITHNNAALFWDNAHTTLGVGTSTPYSDQSNLIGMVVRKDQNAATRSSLINATVGASASVNQHFATGTTNSSVDFQLYDNNGTPYWTEVSGSAITGKIENFGNYNWRSQAGATWMFLQSGQLTLGASGATSGSLKLSGVTSGAITIQPQAAAGTYNWNLPTTAGSLGQVLASGGGVSAPMTWTTLATVATSASAADLSTGILPSARLSGGYSGITAVGTLSSLATSGNITATASGVSYSAINSNSTQFSGPQFKLYNSASSMGNQAGAAFGSLILDAGATQGYFALFQLNNAGAYFQDLMRYNYNADSWTLYTAGSSRFTLDSSGNQMTTGTIRSNAGFNTNGAAGISKTCTAMPTQMTITGGIITAVTGGTCT